MHRAWILTAVAAFAAAGCQQDNTDYYGQVELAEVSGVVKLDGKPVEGAVVVLKDVKTSTESYGLTDASGAYSVQFDSVKKGTLPGEKIVIISTTKKVLGLNSSEDGAEEGESGEESGSSPKKDLIPKAYRVDSVLRANVTESTTLNFNLASDGSTTGPE